MSKELRYKSKGPFMIRNSLFFLIFHKKRVVNWGSLVHNRWRHLNDSF